MKTFTIDAENNITVHASKKVAKATGARVFATEGQFAELIGTDSKRLISIWNSLPGVTPVKKFKDSKTGMARIWKQIQTLGEVALAEQETAVSEPEPAQPAPVTDEVSVINEQRASAEPESATETLSTRRQWRPCLPKL